MELLGLGLHKGRVSGVLVLYREGVYPADRLEFAAFSTFTCGHIIFTLTETKYIHVYCDLP